MLAPADVLVVVATAREGRWVGSRARVLVCGVGPVEAAVATAATLERLRPAAVLHVGVAGARRAAGLLPGAVVLGTEARYSDLAARLEGLERVVRPDPALLARLGAALPEARRAPIATSAAVGGSSDSDVEAMEGFAVLRAAASADVPAVELRVVANEIEEDDRTRWDIEGALRALELVGPRALDAVASR